MTAASAPVAAGAAPTFRLGSRDIKVIKPSIHDVRMRLAAVIITLQVLGQTLLGFKISVAQILITIGVCAVLEFSVVLWRDGILAWPASGLLTGNSTAFILRTTGTHHGDWWSLNGIEWFIAAGVVGLLSKYMIRVEGKHIFNPSNAGLVAILLIAGVTNVFPQYLWWGPLSVGVGLAFAVILFGAWWILRPVRMLRMAVAFWVTLAVLVGILAATGRCMVAVWHPGAICGANYWVDICTSPEVLIFVFFMMSDPVTAPKSQLGRVVYGAATAVIAVALLSFQPAEFGVKLAILASLIVTCAMVRSINRVFPAKAERSFQPEALLRGRRGGLTWITPAILAVVIITIAAPVDTAVLAGNSRVTAVELGLGGTQ
ncbi:MAG TPA: RnfABCDGE type electron transport complex subunit D [Candidatus Dormibacteraeota bacterium]